MLPPKPLSQFTELGALDAEFETIVYYNFWCKSAICNLAIKSPVKKLAFDFLM